MNFQRGIDPKDAMTIGIKSQLEAYIKELDSDAFDSYNGIMENKDALVRLCLRSGRLDFFQYAVAKGGDPHNKEEYCLRWAAKYGYFDIVKYLVEQCNADITSNYNVALRWAEEESHLEIIVYLQEKLRQIKENILKKNKT